MSIDLTLYRFDLQRFSSLVGSGDETAKKRIKEFINQCGDKGTLSYEKIDEQKAIQELHQAIDHVIARGIPVRGLKAEKAHHIFLAKCLMFWGQQPEYLGTGWRWMGAVDVWESVLAERKSPDLGLYKYLIYGRPILGLGFAPTWNESHYGYLTREECVCLLSALEQLDLTKGETKLLSELGCEGFLNDLMECLGNIVKARQDLWATAD